MNGSSRAVAAPAQSVTLRVAEMTDLPQVAATLANAFQDDPIVRWWVRDDAGRPAALLRVFTHLAKEYIPHRHVFLTPDGRVAALWRPPRTALADDDGVAADRSVSPDPSECRGTEDETHRQPDPDDGSASSDGTPLLPFHAWGSAGLPGRRPGFRVSRRLPGTRRQDGDAGLSGKLESRKYAALRTTRFRGPGAMSRVLGRSPDSLHVAGGAWFPRRSRHNQGRAPGDRAALADGDAGLFARSGSSRQITIIGPPDEASALRVQSRLGRLLRGYRPPAHSSILSIALER